ncbi:hypothetical protein [Azospirillum argentinense]
MSKSIIIFTFAIALLPMGSMAAGKKEQKVRAGSVSHDIPQLSARLVFSDPAFDGDSDEETPFQLLQLCRSADPCRTLLDLRGSGNGMTISADPALSFSPDRLYFILLRMTGVTAATKSFDKQYYELMGVKEFGPVIYRTIGGKEATTDTINGWSDTKPHALKITVGRKKTELAYPVP